MRTLLIFMCTVVFFSTRLWGQERGTVDSDPVKKSKEYREGYKQGVAEAEKEIKEGNPTLYMSGLQMSLEHLDRETGLPYTVIAGCVVDTQTLAREVGHDQKIKEHIKAHGLPANSFKRWEKELFDLKGFYNLRTTTDKPFPLALGGPKLKSPDGKFTVSPAQIDFKKDDGTIGQMLAIVVAAEGSKPSTEEILWDEGATDFLWGPKGSRFIVVRCKGGRELDHYMALDLERTTWLRWESEWNSRHRGKPRS